MQNNVFLQFLHCAMLLCSLWQPAFHQQVLGKTPGDHLPFSKLFRKCRPCCDLFAEHVLKRPFQLVCSEVDSMFCCFADIQEQLVVRTLSRSPSSLRDDSSLSEISRTTIGRHYAGAVCSYTVVDEQIAQGGLSFILVVVVVDCEVCCWLWSPVSCPKMCCSVSHTFHFRDL